MTGARSGEQVSADDFVADSLRKKNVTFDTLAHDTAYSSQKAAHNAHVPGNDFGKAVLVKLFYTDDATKIQKGEQAGDDTAEVIMCVLRAPDHILLNRLAQRMDAKRAELCSEAEVREITELKSMPVEPGAVPPLPFLYSMRGVMDAELAKDATIHFKAGSHHKLISMAMHDYLLLTSPTVLPFAELLDIHLRDLTTMIAKCGFPVSHGIIRHSPAVTAAETAKAVHVPGAGYLKTVVVKLDGDFALAVLPSTHVIDLSLLASMSGAKSADLATAAEIRQRFPRCKEGAIPPFGRLFEVPLYVDSGVGQWPIAGDSNVIFNAGTFTEAMIMRFEDYMRLNRVWQEPRVGHFARLDTAAEHPWTSTHFKQYLAGMDVPFISVRHARAYTAPEIAHEAHISGTQLAKTVMLRDKTCDKMAMAVVRADDKVDLHKVNEMSYNEPGLEKCDDLFELAPEESFMKKFEHVEPGAVPPMGHLYQMPTFVDSKLAAQDMIYMNAGTHKELLGLKWTDFYRLVHPTVGPISRGHPAYVNPAKPDYGG